MSRRPRVPRSRFGTGSYWYDDKRQMCVLDWRHDGRSYRERGRSWADVDEARDRRRDALQEAARHAQELSDGGQTTVGTLMAEWLAYDAHGAPQTMMRYRYSGAHIVKHLGERKIHEIRIADLERFYAQIGREGLGLWSLRKVRTHLSMAFAFAVRRGWVTANVVRDSKLPANATRPRDPRWLDRDGFRALRRWLVANPSTFNRALLFSLLTGCRVGEVLGLRWSAVDLDRATAHVVSALQRQENGRCVVVDELKTDTSVRTVQLPPDLVAELRAERAEQRQRRLAAGAYADVSLVFATSCGTPFDPGNVRRACARACRGAGVPAMTPTSLRHSHASALLDAGITPPAVSRQLGHRDGRMVSMVYGHALDATVPTVEALERFA